MHKFKHHALHSGSKRGPIVHDRPQAIAIALSEAGKAKGRADGGAATDPAMAAAYRVKRSYALGGGPAPWQIRQEARSMMHSGPILSAVPGRTDRHNMSLASGAYVIPAQAVSHLGQNNTLAGMKVLGGMFGPGGPYGAGAMKIGHGPGAPKPPRPMGIPQEKPMKFADGGWAEHLRNRSGLAPLIARRMKDHGGARGSHAHIGKPVEVVTAGGEYVVPPHVVMAIGGGDIDHGHAVLDAWVNKIKQDHIRTLRKLPGLAKD